jgi:hypothetical protein|tara:strand:- start:1398 stop:2297 length:900 start_codon:yes stop_codon:yes gene_type:complete
MTQEELMGLIGVLGGLGGSYFLGGKKEDRELERKIKEAKLIAEAEAEIREKEYAKAETRAENKQFRKEGRYTEGDKRGELKNPNSLYNFIFNPSESDPFHEMLGGGVIADSILGTTAYDDPAIRNQEREDFVANPENNFLTDTGALGLGSLFIPGFGLLRGANALSKLGPSMMANLSKMFGGARGATSVTPITDPSRLLPMYNDGGRVNMDDGGLSFFIDPEMDADGFEIPRDPSEVGIANMFLESVGNLVRGAEMDNDKFAFPRRPNKIRKGIYDLIGFDASNYPGFDDLTEFYGAED